MRRELVPLFQKFKAELREKLVDAGGDPASLEDFDRHFYKPEVYLTLGRFDLLLIALLDDTEFAIRTFRTFDPMLESQPGGRESFDHQVMLCPIPRFTRGSDPDASVDPVAEIWGKMSGTAAEKPLIGVCQLKVNPLLGAAVGVSFLRSVMRTLKYMNEGDIQTLASIPREQREVKCIVLESYPWHELLLLVMSDSFEAIARHIRKVASLTLADVTRVLRGLDGRDPREVAEDTAVVVSLERSVGDLAGRLAPLRAPGVRACSRTGEPANGEASLSGCHLFIHTSTTLGFRCAPDGDVSGTIQKARNDSLSWSTQWYVESGHHEALQEILGRARRSMLADLPGEVDACNIMGRGDVWFPVWWRGKGSASLVRTLWDLRSQLRNAYGVTGGTTIAGIPLSVPSTGSKQDFSDYQGLLQKVLSISERRIRAYHRRMVQAGFCKVTASRVLNMLSVYNDAIRDGIMFTSVAELHPFVDWLVTEGWRMMKRIVKGVGRPPSHVFAEMVTNWRIDAFEHAFRNRYRGSHRHGDLPEVNLDFKGGVQQVLTALSGATNAVAMAMDIGTPLTAWVGGRAGPTIGLQSSSLHLNPLHVFQPEYFAAILGHELGHRWRQVVAEDPVPVVPGRPADRPAEPEGRAEGLRDVALALGRRNCFVQAQAIVAAASLQAPVSVEIERLVGNPAMYVVEQTLCDLGGFHFSFGADPLLFAWWSAHVFYQYACNWTPGAFWPDRDRLLLRAMRVGCVLDITGNHEEAADLFEVLFPLDSPVRSLQDRSVVSFRDVVNAFRQGVVESIVGRRLARVNELFATLRHEALAAAGVPTDERFRSEVGRAMRDLATGRVRSLPSGSCSDPEGFAFVHELLVAYLRLIAVANRWRPSVLRRSPGGSPNSERLRKGPPFLFDQRGATFIARAKHRRKYVMWRAALTNGLWDLAMRQKAAYWLDRANCCR